MTHAKPGRNEALGAAVVSLPRTPFLPWATPIERQPRLADNPDFEYLIVDSTIARAHQHAAGAKEGLKIRPLADHVVA